MKNSNSLILEARLSLKELEEMVEARSNTYRFLSALYSSCPSLELIMAVKEKGFLIAFNDLVGPEFDLEAMQESIESMDNTCDELCLEYNHLFVVPNPRYVPPYESVYRDKWNIEYCGIPEIDLSPKRKIIKGLVWGQSTAKVKRGYEKAGFVISEDYKDLPDHIGLEFEFMSVLSNKEKEFRKLKDRNRAIEYLNSEKDFLKKHILVWVPNFCTKVEESTDYAFYRMMAKFTKKFIQWDNETVNSLCQ